MSGASVLAMLRSMRNAIFLLLCAASAVAVQAQQREIDYVQGLKPDPVRGARSYETCAACHGRKGEGVSDGTVPAIGGQHYMVLVKQLADFRADVRTDLRMKHFSDTSHLAYSQEIADVASYIASLPVNPPSAAIPGAAVARGMNVYARQCERCHGPSGEGDAEGFVPRIAAQHAAYLQRQLQEARVGRRESMVRSHAHFAKDLSETDRIAVTQYLAGSPAFSSPQR